jgi:lipocalin
MSGKLYVGFDGTGMFKVGITQDHKSRLRQFRTANPTFHYILVFNVDNPAMAEVEVHSKFSNKLYAGEWYKLQAQDLKWIYDRYTVEGRHGQEDFDAVYEMIQGGMALDLGVREHMKGYYTVDGGEE